MFRTHLVMAGALWLLCLAGMYWLQIHPAEDAAAPISAPAIVSLSQQRQGVQKDIWAVRDGERLHTRLNAARSNVTIQGRKEVVETLHDIVCWVQESVEDERQEVRYFTAPVGTYTFPTHRFVADEVRLAFYELPGTTLPSSAGDAMPVLSGMAEEVVLTAGRSTPVFTAHHLRANVEQWNP